MHGQRGNILFLILLAIILFAALTYAVNSGMRGGGSDASKEGVKAQASGILNFAQLLDSTVMRMTMTGGIPIERVSFEHPWKTFNDASESLSNGNTACTNDACMVYKSAGGGVPHNLFTDAAITDTSSVIPTDPAPGYTDYIMMRWPYAGSDLNDIVLRIWGIKRSVCVELATTLNIPLTASYTGSFVSISTPASWDSATRYFVGDITPYVDKRFAFVYGGSGNGAFCIIMHLVYAR